MGNCPLCGQIEIIAVGKPTTCKNVLKFGKRSFRICRTLLTKVQPS